MSMDRLEQLERMLAQTERDVVSMRHQVERERALRLAHPRIVKVSYVNAHRIDLLRRWDYIDGIGDLRVGDRVVTPRFQYDDCQGVVVAVDEPKEWQGRLKTITERV